MGVYCSGCGGGGGGRGGGGGGGGRGGGGCGGRGGSVGGSVGVGGGCGGRERGRQYPHPPGLPIRRKCGKVYRDPIDAIGPIAATYAPLAGCSVWNLSISIYLYLSIYLSIYLGLIAAAYAPFPLRVVAYGIYLSIYLPRGSRIPMAKQPTRCRTRWSDRGDVHSPSRLYRIDR